MSNQGWVECVSSAQVAGPTLASFTTAVSCLPTQARYTIPQDEWFIGKQLRLRASGQISNVVTAQPTFTWQFMLGPTSNIIAWTSGAILTSTTAHTNLPWQLDVFLTCRAIGGGTAGNLMGQGVLTGRAFIDLGASGDITTTGHPTLMVPETAPAVGTGFDTNVGNIADLFVACGTSNASNALTLQMYTLEILN